MNWDVLSYDWSQVRAFLATAETGSFSAAARALKLTQPTLARQVTALEDHLGVTLFERGKRSMVLTDTGQRLLDHARRMGDAATGLSLTAAGQAQNLAGLVTITATTVFSTAYLPSILAALRSETPEIELQIVAADTLQDLKRREADIAIRHVRPTDEDLVARLAAEPSAGLYARRDYLDQRGRPDSPAQAAALDFIGFDDVERTVALYTDLGLPVTANRLGVRSANGEVVIAMVRAGLGVSMLPDTIAQTMPELEPVLPEQVRLTFPVWLVTHREMRTSPRIRRVFDHLVAHLPNTLR